MKEEDLKTEFENIKVLIKRGGEKPFNFSQAAEYLGFSHSYLYKLTSKQAIPCHRPTGKLLFFSKAELDEWIFNSNNEVMK